MKFIDNFLALIKRMTWSKVAGLTMLMDAHLSSVKSVGVNTYLKKFSCSDAIPFVEGK